MSIKLSKKERAFDFLSHRSKLHIRLTEARTDYQKLLEAITYNEPSLVKFYLDAGVSVNHEAGSYTSPVFHAAVHQNPLIVKMLLDYGADPHFEHKITHSTIIGTIFNDYDCLMERYIDHPIVTEKLNKLVMIAAIMQHAGLQFDTPNSKSESPLDKFGLWVGSERKQQVLAEFLEKINHADISSIGSSAVIARSPEDIIRFSPEEERDMALYNEGRYDDLLKKKFSFGILKEPANEYFTHFSAIPERKQHKPTPLSEETSRLNDEVLKQSDKYISMLKERNNLNTLMADESKDIKERALAAQTLCHSFFSFKNQENQLHRNAKQLLARLVSEMEIPENASATIDSELFGPSETLSSTRLGNV